MQDQLDIKQAGKQLILIVDDVPKNLQYIGILLRKEGIDFAFAVEGNAALKMAREKNPDLILLDINLPGMNGFEVCQRLKTSELTKKIPIIFITAHEEIENIVTGFQLGAVDYVTKPIKTAELLARVKTQLELKLYRDHLEELIKLRTAELENTKMVTILGLAKLAEYRDKDTGLHLERIREFARLLTMELSKMEQYQEYITLMYIDDIYNSSILHDIGKVGIPDEILLKPAKLTPEEFEVIKIHTTLGSNVIKNIETKIKGKSFLSLGREIANYHHEKWDGTGYPAKLKGNAIPLCARIVALADVYDALISRRIYKEAYTHKQAREIILAGKGSHFDPDVVNAFLACELEFQQIKTALDEYDSNHVNNGGRNKLFEL